MAILKRGSVYWIDTMLKGKRIRKSLHTSDRVQAQQAHDKIRAESWEKTYLGDKNRTWEEAIARWFKERSSKKSLHKDQGIITFFNQFFAGKKLNECDIQEALEAKAADVSGTTINRYKSFIRTLYRTARIEWEWDVKIIHFTFSKERARDSQLTDEQFADLLHVLPVDIKDVVEFAAETGLRRSNITSLQQAHFAGGLRELATVSLPADMMKSGKPFSAPISKRAAELAARNNYSFKFNDADYIHFKNAASSIGLPDLRFHDLRHFFASRLGRRGVPLEIIGKLLHHSSIVTTQRYRHYATKELEQYV